MTTKKSRRRRGGAALLLAAPVGLMFLTQRRPVIHPTAAARPAAASSRRRSASPPAQSEFEGKQRAFAEAFRTSKNAIRRSALFNEANEWTNASWAKQGWRLKGWTGRIAALGTSYGGDTVDSLRIQSDIGGLAVAYVADTIARPIAKGSKLYRQLSDLAIGDDVVFDCYFKNGRSNEMSLTEEGRMRGPAFLCVMTNVQKL